MDYFSCCNIYPPTLTIYRFDIMFIVRLKVTKVRC